VLDALLAALVAVAVHQGGTVGPRDELEQELALEEGWIHVPAVALAQLRPPG
jgi:hypothetical protein